MNCEYCGKEEALPFVCNYCGGVYCADHRLPEAHSCKGDLTRKRTIVAPPQTTFTWSDSAYPPQPEVQPGHPFSEIEIRDVAIAYLCLCVAFTVGFSGGVFALSSLTIANILLALAVSLLAVGPGFVLHEMSHKFTARRFGHWAEFRLWPLGLLLALFTSMFGFVFAAPGATYISGQNITKIENGIISIAGPLTNVGVALFFVAPLLLGGGLTQNPSFWGYAGFFGVYVNVFLALFNMLPIAILDGAKVFAWSKVKWASLFVPLALVFIFLLTYF
jgi:Zn-dependent protease